MIDKQQLEKMVVHNLKVKKILFIISMCLFGGAALALAGAIALLITGYDVSLIPDIIEGYTLRSLFIDITFELVAAGLVLLLFSVLIFARRAAMAKAMLDNFDKINEEQQRLYKTYPSGSPIVDAKPVDEAKPKGKYDDLIAEYTKLCDQGLITKEELENKKKELGY